MAQTLVTVHGKFLDKGMPAQGEVTFSDPAFSVDSSTGAVNTPAFVRAYLNQDGEFWAKLPLNVGINSTPQPRTYRCEVSVAGASRVFEFVLSPSLLTVELSDLMAVSSPPSLPAQYVASIGGMTGVISYADFVDQFPSLAPSAGKSAYQLWLDAGNTGSSADFFAALRGLQGIQGLRGPQGEVGPEGPRGARGSAGPAGRPFRIDVIVNDAVSLTAGGGAVGSDGQTTMFPAYSMAAVLSTHEFWYFDGIEWHNLGSYKGETGAPGPSATKQSVGLGNVENLAPADLPVSDATQDALTQLAANVGQVRSVNGQQGDVVLGADDVGLGNVPNFTAAQWPFSTALTQRLTELSDAVNSRYVRPQGGSTSTFLRGDDTWRALTASDVGLGNVANYPSMGVLDGVTSLDSLTGTGVYQQTSDTVATTARSYPIARAGFLVVQSVASGTRMVVQTYLTYGYKNLPPKVYRRSVYGTQAWSDWNQVVVNGLEDLVVSTLRTLSGYGFSPSGVASVRSLVLAGGYTDALLDSGPTGSALVYPFAPSATAGWQQYPQGISYWRMLAGAAGSPTDYPLATGTLVNYRHNNYPRQELWGATGVAYVRAYTGGTWTNWKTVEQEMASGRFTTALTANTIKTVAITFPPGRFTTPPDVQVTAVTTVPDRVRAGVSDITTDGANVYCWRNTDSNTTYSWFAFNG